MKTEQAEDIENLKRLLDFQDIANVAVANAQEENRSLGIPNWYSINGKIISDQQIEQIAADQENKK